MPQLGIGLWLARWLGSTLRPWIWNKRRHQTTLTRVFWQDWPRLMFLDETIKAMTRSTAMVQWRQKRPLARHRNRKAQAQVIATACDLTKFLFDVCQTPCGHFYCQECMKTLFELLATDETLFPPRCCLETIPLQSIKIYLSSIMVQTFEDKSIEYETSDRTYSSQPAYSSFFAADGIIGEQATCKEYGSQTCTICKKNTHDGDCPQDIATQQVLETAREQGWQPSFNSRRLVELDVGCNHMVYVLL